LTVCCSAGLPSAAIITVEDPNWKNCMAIDKLEAGLEEIRQSPRQDGLLAMIVRRPRVGEREVVKHGELTAAEGLVGDRWRPKVGRHNDGIDVQLTLMNARAIALIAGEKSQWPLAGDQLFVDFDLSDENAPAGTRLAIGSAIVEVTPPPHTGCSKFSARFGPDAVKFVNSPAGRQLRLRGVNAKVVQAGTVRVGDAVKKLEQNR
jgi:MOSC domain-containing protein YiiM